jgi:mannitol-specific phosphotransferase system IIBC component
VTSGEADAPRLVRTIVCVFSGELPTAWLAVFHRFERQVGKAGLRIRVRIAAIESLPERFEILVVPPELETRARELAGDARVIATTREEAAGAVEALLREIAEGRSLYALPVRPGEPKIVTHRGMEEL